MEKENYTEFRNRLQADLDDLLARDEEARGAIRRKDPAGNLSFEDLGIEGEFDDVLDSLGDRSRAELLGIWNALQRMDQGVYGVCRECGQKIHVERLKAIPATEYCVTCAARLEQGSSH